MSIVLLAMASVAGIVIPNEAARLKRLSVETQKPVSLLPARTAANRMLLWGVVLGVLLVQNYSGI